MMGLEGEGEMGQNNWKLGKIGGERGCEKVGVSKPGTNKLNSKT